MDAEIFEARSAAARRVRDFFDGRGYIEVDTPILSPSLIPENCLEVFKTEYISAAKGAAPKELYLVPSPEIWMKKIMARKKQNIYQICKCFRNCESKGSSHNPEFTMLEYYTSDAGYIDSIGITEELFNFILDDKIFLRFEDKARLNALRPPFKRITMEDAFKEFAGFSLAGALSAGSLREHACAAGIELAEGINDGGIYDTIFIHSVEPRLREDNPVILMDYPVISPCLASVKKEDCAFFERWELYARGLEIANCYSEETSREKTALYFEKEAEIKKKNARVSHNISSSFQDISLPRCSGVALGFDRLLMLLLGRKTIDSVIPFL